MFSLVTALVLIFSIFAVGLPIKSTAIKGSEIQISNKEYNEQNPFAIYIPDKDLWFVTWEYWKDGNADIYGRFIKPDGTLCGNPFRINSNLDGNQTVPKATYNPDKKYIVIIWQDSTNPYVKYNHIDVSNIDTNDCTGFYQGTDKSIGYNSIYGDTLISRQKPVIKYDPVNNRYLAVWIEKRDKFKEIICSSSTSLGDNLYVGYAYINDDLTISNANIKIIQTYTPRVYRGREIYYDTTSGIYSVEIFKEISNVDVGIDTTANEQLIVFEAKREKVVVDCSSSSISFEDFFEGESDNKHIYGIFLKDSQNSSIPSMLLDSVELESYQPSVAFDPIKKRFFVVWESIDKTLSDNPKIYGQLISSGIGKYGENILISYEDMNKDGQLDEVIINSKQTNPYVSYDSVNQRYFVVWQDGRNHTVSIENLDIYGQKVDLEGSLRGFNFLVVKKPYNQLNPVVAYSFKHNIFLVLWKDASKLEDFSCGTSQDLPCGSDINGVRFSLENQQISILDENDLPLAPPILNFGKILYGTSKTKTLKLVNTGDTDIYIDCIKNSSNSNFKILISDELKSCDSNYLLLKPSDYTYVTVLFFPQKVGKFTASLEVESVNANSVYVFLSGQAMEPLLTIEENDKLQDNVLDFEKVKVGKEKVLSFFIKNESDSNITIKSINNLKEPYSIIPNFVLPKVLTPNETVQIIVSFSPETKGKFIDTIYIETDIPDIKLSLDVKGEGIAPILEVEPLKINFGNVKIGKSIEKTLTLKNSGNDVLKNIKCILNSDEFKLKTSCPEEISAGSSITIPIEFSPNTTGKKSSTLTVSAGNQSVNVDLTGNAIKGVLEISPSSLNFGEVAVNDFKIIKLTLKNTGDSDITIESVDKQNLPVSFFVDIKTPIVLKPNNQIFVNVKFNPSQEGISVGSFTLSTNYESISIGVTGIGVKQTVKIVQPENLSFNETLNFGTIKVGETLTKSIRIKNVSNGTVKLQSIDSPTNYFSVLNPENIEGRILEPGEYVDILVRFSPEELGLFTSQIGLLFDISSEPFLIFVKGSSIDRVSVNDSILFIDEDIYVSNLNFGKVLVGERKEKIIKIKNNSGEKLTINNIFLTEKSNFSLLGMNTPIKLLPYEEKEIKIIFSPKKLGTISTTLNVVDETGYVYQLNITGEGYPVKVFSQNSKIIDYKVLNIKTTDLKVKDNIKIITSVKFLAIDINQRANFSIKLYQNLNNIVVYKITKNGDLKELNNISIDNNTISFEIEDNSEFDLDERKGIIEDPIIIGTISQTSSEKEYSDINQIMPSSGTGGCNMDNNNGNILIVIIMLTLILLRKIPLKNITYIFFSFAFIFFMTSCDIGGGADTGITVKVSASTGNTTFIASDIVNIYDENENNICGDIGDKLVIPAEEDIDIFFKVTKLNPSLPDSEIRIEKAVLEYYPKKDTYPDIEPLAIYIGTTFTKSATVTIPVIDNEVKEYFLAEGYKKGEYYVKVTFTLIEVDYNKELIVDTGFNLDLSNRLEDENECKP